MQQRRRLKSNASFQDRLALFAADARQKASLLPPGPEKDDLARKVRQTDTAAHLSDSANSPGLQPPK
jgi:hypothetical protein